MSITIQAAFAPSYARARVLFLEAAASAGLAIRSHNHPLPGSEGETLALDLALDGPADAERLLIVSSACHGVEGFCGSGVQVFSLHDEPLRQQARAAGVTLLYIHALNPHGFSHLRRVTHENIDLNRNFPDFSQPLPVNQPYAELHPLLLPAEWPPSDVNESLLAEWVSIHGAAAFQSAVSQGQHAFADGLFFGGTAPSWSHLTLRRVLQTHGQHARQIGWIDVHTGLGPSGVGERIFAGHDDAVAIRRARAWWDGDGATPITSIYDGSSTSARLTGLMWGALPEECPLAEYTGMALEFGTLPLDEVLLALRADHWLQRHPQAPPALRATIRQQIKAAFYTDTDVWRTQVIGQARQAMLQAIAGLSGAAV